jgi:hypothetical protein
VYKRSPYSRRPGPDVRNAADSIYVNGGSRSVVKVWADGAGGYVGSIAMGVSRG